MFTTTNLSPLKRGCWHVIYARWYLEDCLRQQDGWGVELPLHTRSHQQRRRGVAFLSRFAWTYWFCSADWINREGTIPALQGCTHQTPEATGRSSKAACKVSLTRKDWQRLREAKCEKEREYLTEHKCSSSAGRQIKTLQIKSFKISTRDQWAEWRRENIRGHAWQPENIISVFMFFWWPHSNEK